MNKTGCTDFLKNNQEGWEILAKYREMDLTDLVVSQQEGKRYSNRIDTILFRWSKDICEIEEPVNCLLKRELTKGTKEHLKFSVYPNEEGVLIIFGKTIQETEAIRNDHTLISSISSFLGGMALLSSGPAILPGVLFGAGISGFIYAKMSKTEDYDPNESKKQIVTGAITSLVGGAFSKILGPVIANTVGSSVVSTLFSKLPVSTSLRVLCNDVGALALRPIMSILSSASTNYISQAIQKEGISKISGREVIAAGLAGGASTCISTIRIDPFDKAIQTTSDFVVTALCRDTLAATCSTIVKNKVNGKNIKDGLGVSILLSGLHTGLTVNSEVNEYFGQRAFLSKQPKTEFTGAQTVPQPPIPQTTPSTPTRTQESAIRERQQAIENKWGNTVDSLIEKGFIFHHKKQEIDRNEVMKMLYESNSVKFGSVYIKELSGNKPCDEYLKFKHFESELTKLPHELPPIASIKPQIIHTSPSIQLPAKQPVLPEVRQPILPQFSQLPQMQQPQIPQPQSEDRGPHINEEPDIVVEKIHEVKGEEKISGNIALPLIDPQQVFLPNQIVGDQNMGFVEDTALVHEPEKKFRERDTWVSSKEREMMRIRILNSLIINEEQILMKIKVVDMQLTQKKAQSMKTGLSNISKKRWAIKESELLQERTNLNLALIKIKNQIKLVS